jgi:outer membrane protein assembly factor BamB
MRNSIMLLIVVSAGLVALTALAPPATVGGTVKSVSADGQLTLSVGRAKAAKEQVFRITAATKLTLDGKSAKAADLSEGIKATVTYDKTSKEAVSIRAVTAKPEPTEAQSAGDAVRPVASDGPARAKRSAAVPTASAAVRGEWPQWRGPNRDGKSTETALLKQWPKDGPTLIWKTTVLGDGYSSVSVVGGRIFTMGLRSGVEHVIALDVKGGKEIWSTAIGPAQAGGGGYPGPRCTPTVDGELLYALGIDGELVCLEVATGKERWRKELTKDFQGSLPGWGYSESPLVDGEKVVCTPGGGQGAVLALDKKNGQPVWRSKEFKDGAMYSSLVIAEVAGTRQYVQMTGQSVAGVAAANGQLLWQVPRQGPTAAVPTPVVDDGYVYVTSGYGAGCNLIKLTPEARGTNAKELYANKTMVNHHGGVVLIGDHLYGYSDGKGWVCQEFKTGKMVWNEKDKLGKGSVTYADGQLYARNEDGGSGTVALLEATPRGYSEKGRFNQPDRSGKNTWPHPVVAGGRLYLRDQHVLLCYDVKGDGVRAAGTP